MIRKIKGIGVALVAVMALGIVGASAAQGSEIHITTGAHSVIFGQQHVQQHKFQLTGPNVSTGCTQVLYEGTHAGGPGQQSTTQDITLTATYTGCQCFGVACQIKMNGCKYTLTGEGQAAQTFKVDITGCTEGKSIEVVSLIGTATVPAQTTIGGHITFANEGSGQTQSLTGQITLQGMKYECHGSIPGCAATTPTSDGDCVGQATFVARLYAGEIQAEHNGHKYQKFNQTGEIRGLFVT